MARNYRNSENVEGHSQASEGIGQPDYQFPCHYDETNYFSKPEEWNSKMRPTHAHAGQWLRCETLREKRSGVAMVN